MSEHDSTCAPGTLPIAFETKRLRVYLAELQPNDGNIPRDVFIAFRTDEDRPMVCATAVIWRRYHFWVDWLEVTSQYRRSGFAKEFREGIEAFYGHELYSEAATPEGEAFLKSLGRL